MIIKKSRQGYHNRFDNVRQTGLWLLHFLLRSKNAAKKSSKFNPLANYIGTHNRVTSNRHKLAMKRDKRYRGNFNDS